MFRRLQDVATSLDTSGQSSSAEGPETHTTVSPPGSPPPERVEKVVQLYRGSEGKTMNISANYLKMGFEKGRGVFEYEVSYDPRVDNRNSRFRLFNQHREVYGAEKVAHFFSSQKG